jgi:hypothetical protein
MFTLERVTRIELALSAWEAEVLPLNYTRTRTAVAAERCPPGSTDALGHHTQTGVGFNDRLATRRT